MNSDKVDILKYLNKTKTKNASELIDFLSNEEDFYSRQNNVGHITASAFIISHDEKHVLLIEHAKYNMWLSPGGHVDSGENSLQAAIRETLEETGVSNMELIKKDILDIDIHRIPNSEKKGEPEHWHFDVRYLFKAPKELIINLNPEVVVKAENGVKINTQECNGYKWYSLKEMKNHNDLSLKRQAEKVIDFLSPAKRRLTM